MNTKVPFMSPESSPGISRPAGPGSRPERGASWRYRIVLVLAVLVTFWQATSGAFVNDDLTLLARNPSLTEPDGLMDIVGQPMWAAVPEFASGDRVGHWRPVTSLVFAAGHALGGGASAPLPFHLMSLLFHALAALAAFGLARRLLGSDRPAFAAALLFALHPLQTESVAWISALNDPLAAALVFAGLERWLAWRERGAGLPWAAAGLFFVALLTKEPAVAFLPLVLVLELGLRLLGRTPRDARPWSGFALLGAAALAWYALRIWVFGEAAAGFFRTNADYGDHGLRLRRELIGSAAWRTLWPFDLAPGEPFREVWSEGATGRLTKLVGFGALAIGLAVAAWKRSGWGLLITLGFLAALLPPLVGAGSLGQTPFAARYVYVPVFFAALGAGLLVRRAPAALALVAVVAGVFAWRVQVHQATWDGPTAYYERVTEAYPRSPNGFWNLGETLRGRYIDSTAAADGSQGIGDLALLEDAFQAYEAASRLLERAAKDATIPKDELDYLQTGIGQAWSYLLQAEVDEYRDFDTPRRILEMLLERVLAREAVNRAEGYPRPPLPVEQVFNTLGIVELRAGDRTAAADAFRRALEQDPNYVPALRNLGLVRLGNGEHALASQLLKRALDLVPDDPDVLDPYARSLFEEGWPDRALELAEKLARIEPSSPTPATLRGLRAMQRRDFRTALNEFDRALEKSPRAPGPLYHRGMALEQLGETDQAIAALRRATEADPLHFAAHYNLARMLLDAGANAAATPYLERAYVIGDGRSQLATIRPILLQLDPEDAPRMRELAEVDDRRGDAEGALFWTERALNLDPDNGRSRHLMGQLLMASGEHVLALPELVRAAELLPKGFVVFEDLGRVNAELGRYPAARAAYERALELIEGQTYAGAPSDPPEAKQAFESLKSAAASRVAKRLSELPPPR